jgi:hypothetical protein
LIYADWLEERDDPRAEFLRLEARLAELKGLGNRQCWGQVLRRLRELRGEISPDWLARLDRTAIENCALRFAFQCPKRWENLLQRTEDTGVRFCEACRKDVYFCRTVQEAQRRAALGHCVAVDSRLERRSGDLHPPRPLRRGDRVRVINGRYEGREGVIQRVNRSGRHAIVRVQLGDRRVGFSVDDLQRC